MSGLEGAPTGGELTRFQAVGRVPDCLSLCRSSPVGDVRRDLIEAWPRPKQAVSAGIHSIESEGGRDP